MRKRKRRYKDGDENMYSTLEKFMIGSVVIGMTLLILFMNATNRTEISINSLPNDPVMVEPVEIPVIVEEVTEYTEEPVVDEAVLEVVVVTPSFNEAFQQARVELGPGQTFEWNGNLYVTDYFDEIQVAVEQYSDENDQTIAYQTEQ